MIIETFKPALVFIDIFESIKYIFPTAAQAYDYAEKIYSHRYYNAFAVHSKAYESYVSFYNAYLSIKGFPPRVFWVFFNQKKTPPKWRCF